MNISDPISFAQLMAGLCELYGKRPTEALTEIYWRALMPYAITDVAKAIDALLTHPDTGQFMPKPADVIRYLAGSSQTQGLKAWTKVEKAMQQVGAYASIVFDDALIHSVIIDMGGWITLCKTSLKELPFKAQEFQKRYQGYVQHPCKYYPKQLTGICAHQNSQTENSTEPQVLFGNALQAQAVFEQGQSAHQLFERKPLVEETITSSKSTCPSKSHDKPNKPLMEPTPC